MDTTSLPASAAVPTARRAARRAGVAACLVATAALSAVSNATAPDFPVDAADRLQAMAGAGDRAWVSAFAFVLAQLPFVLAVLGLGALLRERLPRLAPVATGLAVLGGFGHAVFGGVSLTGIVLAADGAHRAVHAEVLEDVESSPIMAFAVMGLLSTVLGLVLLSVALWRGRLGPRWVPVVLGAFLVVEFAGSAVTAWSFEVAAVLYLIAFGALARALLEPGPDVV
ncbi:DUF4386 family protein [Nocardioides sp. HDW12B]|uniref:DUF4386 family protein n=1 Tax=Nocardioides sp. HDW12B TaxID=2714939 RepID=UPI00140D6A98|nr:DUF4386 family protein [Nocardioides sp. HDW12B]QIK65771.1 DUF4386 family protein [Nocardioides sp. HDW12B]